MLTKMRKRWKRKSGEYVPKYCDNIPFRIRVKYDFLEERKMYNDWDDWRDGMRESIWYQRFGNKPFFKKSKLRMILTYEYWQSHYEKDIINSMKKWKRKYYWRKISKFKKKYEVVS